PQDLFDLHGGGLLEGRILRSANPENGICGGYRTRIVASPSSIPMLTTSVAVVRKMLEAVAGSKPKRLSVSGTMAPATPLAMHEPIIAISTTKASMKGWRWF